jgi:hypothetical protein
MEFYGWTAGQMQSALANADETGHYNGNLRLDVSREWSTRNGSRVRAVLRARDSHKRGARTSWQGRHTVAASWYAHRDFMHALFEINPDGRIKTAMADYRGSDGFERDFPETFWKNAGSAMQPTAFGSLSIE